MGCSGTRKVQVSLKQSVRSDHLVLAILKLSWIKGTSGPGKMLAEQKLKLSLGGNFFLGPGN